APAAVAAGATVAAVAATPAAGAAPSVATPPAAVTAGAAPTAAAAVAAPTAAAAAVAAPTTVATVATATAVEEAEVGRRAPGRQCGSQNDTVHSLNLLTRDQATPTVTLVNQALALTRSCGAKCTVLALTIETRPSAVKGNLGYFRRMRKVKWY